MRAGPNGLRHPGSAGKNTRTSVRVTPEQQLAGPIVVLSNSRAAQVPVALKGKAWAVQFM
jgi:hypothetical protein